MQAVDPKHPTLAMGRIRHVFMVGICGAGMSGIAEVLARLGFRVSGSDLTDGSVAIRLRSLGIRVHIGHRADHVNDADVLVVSAAVSDRNSEVLAAKKLRIPVVPRAEMLAELMRYRIGIAVAGTHGKTTTTSLIAAILGEAGADPTFVIGGLLNQMGTNAALGSGQYLVVEADESDASFLHLQPVMALITNIEADHMEHYEGDLSRYMQAFDRFLHNLPFYGTAIMCIDDHGVREVIPEVTRRVITYGRHAKADYRLENYRGTGLRSQFDLIRPPPTEPLCINVNMPGLHNAQNAAGAAALCSELGVKDEAILVGLAEFEGVGRRFSDLGEVFWSGGSARLIDDYGHHPTEVFVTLKAARSAFPGRRIVMVFQPHRYSRTRDHLDEFVSVLSEVSSLILLDVYAAGEAHLKDADTNTLACCIRKRGEINPIVVLEQQRLAEVLIDILQDNDVLLMQGAGDIGGLAAAISEASSLEMLK